MRRILVLLSFPILLLGTGCSAIQDALKVEFETDFTIDLPISMMDPEVKMGPYPFDVSRTLDLSGDESLTDYIDRIRSIELTQIVSTVTDLSEAIQLINATLTVTGNGETAEWTFNNLDITNGTILSLANDNGQLATISSILSSMGVVTVRFQGMSNTTGVEYTLSNVLSTLVTAGL